MLSLYQGTFERGTRNAGDSLLDYFPRGSIDELSLHFINKPYSKVLFEFGTWVSRSLLYFLLSGTINFFFFSFLSFSFFLLP